MLEIRVRIDKWLWAARFYKTRAIASQAVSGGKIQVNQIRIKPSYLVKIDDEIRISRPQLMMTVQVTNLAERRGTAAQAQALYVETAESIRKREEYTELNKFATQCLLPADKKPSKRERRQIDRLRRNQC